MCGEKVRSDLNKELEVGSPPHVRGKANSSHPIPCAFGSPPHVRGKVHCNRYRACGAGITPACAGKREAEVRMVV